MIPGIIGGPEMITVALLRVKRSERLPQGIVNTSAFKF
jgi:hypothetical protein